MAPHEDQIAPPDLGEYKIDTNVSPAAGSHENAIASACSEDATIVGSPAEGKKEDTLHSPEKPATVQVAELNQPLTHQIIKPTSWRPSLLRAGPISGLLALAFGVLQVIAAHLILALSDGKPVDSWRYQPTIDGPLLQRASTLTSAITSGRVNLVIDLAPELPSYMTGATHYPGNTNYLDLDDSLKPVVKDYGAGAPIKLSNSAGCSGKCSTTVLAPAFAELSCPSKQSLYDFSTPMTVKQMQSFNQTGLPPSDRAIFQVYHSLLPGSRESITFHTKVVQQPKDGSCATYVNTTSCSLRSAIGRYPVEIQDGYISIKGPPVIIAEANNTALDNSTIDRLHLYNENTQMLKTTLSGVAIIANTRFYSDVYLVQWPTALLPQLVTVGSGWFTWLQGWFNTGNGCIPDLGDPRDEIIHQLNELIFRFGVHYGSTMEARELGSLMDNGLEVRQAVTGTIDERTEVFQTELKFFAAAAAVELFTIAVILCTFRGYWKLGRATSLSPLETGKAFDAAALRDAGSNDNTREIELLLGDHHIQYGILENEMEYTAASRYLPAEKLAELTFYVLALFFTLRIGFRHHHVVWPQFGLLLITLISSLRIASASMLLYAETHSDSADDIATSVVVIGVCISSLLLSLLFGVQHLVNLSMKRAHQTAGTWHIILLRWTAAVALIVSIVGAVKISTSVYEPSGYESLAYKSSTYESSVCDSIAAGRRELEAASVLYLAVYLALATLIVLQYLNKASAPTEERKYLAAGVAALPFILVRMIYYIIGAFSSAGSMYMSAFMEFAMEAIVVVIFMAASWMALKKPRYAGAEGPSFTAATGQEEMESGHKPESSGPLPQEQCQNQTSRGIGEDGK
ncbi:uncharacterized protein LTR77_006329 [Saxophila tyrrhenica]|uniref:DUF7702 domain-containing protein n=1 Tax=Saxophila tyrrhenica TaxID=1690608 RepID=A0AAV9P884_9PEZI|nr:hypothetical protein LTR77_006329 [Saxophila tyrrhenica]